MHELSATGVTVRYGDAIAVRDVDLVAPGGRVTAVVGPNGAGKSSLLLAIYGSIAATGTFSVDGEDVSTLSTTERLRAGVALVPQGRQLFPRLTVRENLQIVAELLRLGPAHVDAAMDRFPILSERSKALAGVLSGGEQQMLVVTRALMGEPRVLLLDEMMTGLAPKIVAELAETVAELATSAGIPVVVVEPSLGAISRIVDIGVVLVRGEIVAWADEVDELGDRYRSAMGVTTTA